MVVLLVVVAVVLLVVVVATVAVMVIWMVMAMAMWMGMPTAKVMVLLMVGCWMLLVPRWHRWWCWCWFVGGSALTLVVVMLLLFLEMVRRCWAVMNVYVRGHIIDENARAACGRVG